MNISQAKEIVIADYLKLYGFIPAKIQGDDLWYCSPLRHEKTPSFKVSQSLNCWYDHGIRKGGNIIDLVMSMHGLNNIFGCFTASDIEFATNQIRLFFFSTAK